MYGTDFRLFSQVPCCTCLWIAWFHDSRDCYNTYSTILHLQDRALSSRAFYVHLHKSAQISNTQENPRGLQPFHNEADIHRNYFNQGVPEYHVKPTFRSFRNPVIAQEASGHLLHTKPTASAISDVSTSCYRREGGTPSRKEKPQLLMASHVSVAQTKYINTLWSISSLRYYSCATANYNN